MSFDERRDVLRYKAGDVIVVSANTAASILAKGGETKPRKRARLVRCIERIQASMQGSLPLSAVLALMDKQPATPPTTAPTMDFDATARELVGTCEDDLAEWSQTNLISGALERAYKAGQVSAQRVIYVRKEPAGSGFQAHLGGLRSEGRWARGDTVNEAIGDLIRSHEDALPIQLTGSAL